VQGLQLVSVVGDSRVELISHGLQLLLELHLVSILHLGTQAADVNLASVAHLLDFLKRECKDH